MTSLSHVVCPHCDAVNRLPADRPAVAANCGKCHRKLFEGKPVALTGRRLRIHIARNDIPVLIDFWAPWCGPCRAMAPQFERAAAQLEPGIRLVKLNTEDEQPTAAAFDIRSIPTLALFRDGRELARTAGAMDLRSLVGWTREHLVTN